MKCSEAINRYMALDKHETVPFAVTVHLLRCEKCRSLVRVMTKTARMYSSVLTETVTQDDSLMQKTMDKINKALPGLMYLQAEKARSSVRLFPWVITGLTMTLGLASVPFTRIGQWAVEIFQLRFIIPFALTFAAFVSVFSALFVGRNLDFFIKKFDLKLEAAD